MSLPVNPLTGQYAAWSPEYLAVANHIKQNHGCLSPYSAAYVESLGINPADPEGE